MSLLRKYKCYILTNEVDDTTKEIFDFVNDKLKNLALFKYNEFKYHTFYINSDNKCIFSYDNSFKINSLYIRYEEFWKILVSKYKLKHYDVQEFIEYKIKKIYKLNVKTSKQLYDNHIKLVEKAYKRK